MKRPTVRLLVVIAVTGLVLGLAGCESEMNTSPIMPGETAVLLISFSPSPVYEGYGNTYTFTVFVDEVNGVGADLRSIKIENIDDEDTVIETDTYRSNEIIQTFGTTRIEAYGRLMTNVSLECYNCARQSWLIRADDDKGNYVEYSQSVELIAR
jgi:hypothetical protein